MDSDTPTLPLRKPALSTSSSYSAFTHIADGYYFSVTAVVETRLNIPFAKTLDCATALRALQHVNEAFTLDRVLSLFSCC